MNYADSDECSDVSEIAEMSDEYSVFEIVKRLLPALDEKEKEQVRTSGFTPSNSVCNSPWSYVQ